MPGCWCVPGGPHRTISIAPSESTGRWSGSAALLPWTWRSLIRCLKSSVLLGTLQVPSVNRRESASYGRWCIPHTAWSLAAAHAEDISGFRCPQRGPRNAADRGCPVCASVCASVPASSTTSLQSLCLPPPPLPGPSFPRRMLLRCRVLCISL